MVTVLDNTILLLIYATNAVILLIAFLVSFRGKRIYSVLPGALFLFHMASFTHFKSVVAEFSFNTVFLGQSLMLVANCLLFATCIVFDSFLLRNSAPVTSVRKWLITPHYSKRRYLIIMAVISFVIIAVTLRNGMGRISVSWEDARESANMIDSLVVLLSFIIFPSVWVAFRSKFYLLALLLGLLCFSVFQVIGSRAVLLTLLASVYAELLLTDRSLQKKITILALLGVLGFGLHILSRLTRGLGLVGIINIILAGQLTASMGALDNIDLSGGESDIYRYYNYVIDKSYDSYPYRAWVTVKRLSLLYLPTGWSHDIKPADITYTLYANAFTDGLFDEDAYYLRVKSLIESGQTGSIHPTLWGDAYINGGLVGILLYPFWFGFVLVMIERYMRKLNSVGIFMIVPLTIAGYMMIARGNIVIGFGYLGYIIPIAIVLAYIMRLPLIAKKKRINVLS